MPSDYSRLFENSDRSPAPWAQDYSENSEHKPVDIAELKDASVTCAAAH